MRVLRLVALLAVAALLSAAPAAEPERTVRSTVGSRVKTLDPAQADDLASRNLVGAVYDTLLQYDYLERPYRLKPSMLAEMPEANERLDVYRFRLRDDLRFADDLCFAGQPEAVRRITADDVRYSILRIADARNHSPVYWMFRGKLLGLDAFHERSAELPAGDDSCYEMEFPGFRKLNDLEFELHLSKPDPRFLYMLAMPNSAVVSRRAVEFYGPQFPRKPVGSGPFRLTEWINDYKLVLDRNPEYRHETFAGAENPADRERPLPLADRLVLYLIKQPMSAWLLFLQGNLDIHTVEKDDLDLVTGGSKLAPALVEHGVKLQRAPEFEIRYVGFNFSDPKLGTNRKLRQALSLAYNVQRRVEHSNYQLIPAHGPIPPGVAGYDPAYRNPNAADDPERARQLLAEAGYPDGIDPENGERLRFTFDQTGNNSFYRQQGELAVADFAEIGVEVEAVLNNDARFYEKLRQGRLQLFRLSWVGDYPDAENFLQLFYGPNAGSSNRVCCTFPEFDRMYREIREMPDSPMRKEKYETMAKWITGKCPWIFESHPVSFLLKHCWLGNYRPHDFAFNRWKYLSVDSPERNRKKAAFTPLSMNELRK